MLCVVCCVLDHFYCLIYLWFNRLWYANDYRGNVCGKHDNVGSKLDNCKDNDCKYAYYPRLNEDFITSTKNLVSSGFDLSSIKMFGVCMDHCPQIGEVVCTYEYKDKVNNVLPTVSDVSKCNANKLYKLTNEVCQNCWITPLNTSSVLYRCIYNIKDVKVKDEKCFYPQSIDGEEISATDNRCITKELTTIYKTQSTAQENPLIDMMGTWKFYIGGWLADITTARWVIITNGLLVSLLLGFIFIFLFKYIIGCFIYCIMACVMILMFCFTIFCFYQGGVIDPYNFIPNITVPWGNTSAIDEFSGWEASLPSYLQPSPDVEYYWEVAGYIMIGMTLIGLIFIVLVCRKIKIIIAVMNEASNAIFKMPSLIFLPLMPTILTFICALFFSFSAAMIYTAGSETITDLLDYSNQQYEQLPEGIRQAFCDATSHNCTLPLPTAEVNLNDVSFALMWVNLFGFFWSQQFCQALFMITLAGAIAQWYFLPFDEKTSKKEIHGHPAWTSFMMALRYHLGSLACGSFCIAFIQLIRSILLYIQTQFKEQIKNNKLVKCLCCVCSCCLWCLEKFVKYISRNAYIIIAIKGKGFCSAAGEAFSVIFSNIGTLSGLNVASTLAITLAKFFITAGCACIAYAWFTTRDDYQIGGPNELTNNFIPTLLAGILAFLIASSFMGLYGMTVDSIMLCFCEDMEHNNLSFGDHTPDSLMKAIGKSVDKKKKQSDSIKTVNVRPSDPGRNSGAKSVEQLAPANTDDI